MAVSQDVQAAGPRDRNSLRLDNGFACESQTFPLQIPARSLFDRLRDLSHPLLRQAAREVGFLSPDQVV